MARNIPTHTRRILCAESHQRVCRQRRGCHWAAISQRRCFAVYSILKEIATEMRGSLLDFELVYDLGDLPLCRSHKSTLDQKPMPGFGAVRCWEKGFMSFPMFGSHDHWKIRDVDEKNSRILHHTPLPFDQRRGAAVSRRWIQMVFVPTRPRCHAKLDSASRSAMARVRGNLHWSPMRSAQTAINWARTSGFGRLCRHGYGRPS